MYLFKAKAGLRCDDIWIPIKKAGSPAGMHLITNGSDSKLSFNKTREELHDLQSLGKYEEDAQ